MKRLKGPELKMPKLKVPVFLADLFYDLRDRRLLPLVGLVVVAIVAVPFLLGDKSEETLEPVAGGGISAALESAQANSSRLTVVEAEPGLRDYRKRLHGRQPTDPFKQRYTGPSLEGAELNEQGEGGEKGAGSKSGSEKTSKSTTNGSSDGGDSSPSPAPSPGGQQPPAANPPSGGGSSPSPHLTFFAFAIDVRIVKSVDGVKQEPIVREKVLPQTPLPGEKTPVVTYMGPAREGRKPNGKVLLLVSNDVREISGDATCVSGDEVCQLLEVEPQFPLFLTYGEEEVKYTIDVLKLGLVVTGHN